ncbi:60S acidic ribosomal protein p2b-like [Trifolium pratense]|uniref:60S acidic ribosomal protein p2b-like n=1 Tax=Trifolium pratense TaxID=57577 RepID=A0A2K3M4V5_TRIPR|nr:60S acidic ribosomal protein p2b-like [Trifolium pratense]
MKVVAAYLLAVLGGNDTPSAKTIKDILGSVGAEAEDDRIELFLSEIKGKDLAEVIASGREKLASVPSGGGVAVAAAPASGGGAAPAAAEAKKEEKVEEKEESDDLGFDLSSVVYSSCSSRYCSHPGVMQNPHVHFLAAALAAK